MKQRSQDTTDLADVRQLDERLIKIVWHFAWWDGPLHGLAEYQNQMVWFDFHHDDEDGKHYAYVLYELTAHQLSAAQQWYETRGTWDASAWRWVGRDTSHHDEHWLGPDFAGVRPIGWFLDGANPNFYAIQVERKT